MDIAIIINSCLKYYKTTVPTLLQSLSDSGVNLANVYIIVGESDLEYSEGNTHFVTYANIDENALFWACETKVLDSYNFVFYLHDTCKVDLNFFKNLQKCDYKDHNALKIHDPFSMSIGFYKIEALKHILPLVSSFKNFNKTPQHILNIKLQSEDRFFKVIQSTLGGVDFIRNTYTISDNNALVYGTNVSRIVEYYEMPGIYKIKANYNVHPTHINL